MTAEKKKTGGTTSEEMAVECPKLSRLSSAENFTVNMVNEEEFKVIKKYP